MSTGPPTNNNDARRRFRLQGKNFILTWPQCNETKEAVLGRVVEHYGEALDFAVVSHENHQDGSPHLHAVLSFKDKRTFSGAHCFDSMANSHGNYQTARQLRQSVKYVVKDGDFIAHGVDVAEYLTAAEKGQSTKATVMALKMAEGADLPALNELDPGYVLMNLKKLKEYHSHLHLWKLKPPKTWIGMTTDVSALSPALVKLVGWLNKNLGRPRRMRQKQLLLSSPPGMGKTTLKESLRQFFVIYDHGDGKWFCEFDPQKHDIICFEEFRGLPLTMMNKVLDGSTVRLETKGGTVVKTSERNLPVLILTNLVKDEMFTGPETKSASRDAFFDRVEYIRLEEGDEAWRVLPYIIGLDVEEHMEDDEEEGIETLASMSSSSSASSGTPLPSFGESDFQSADFVTFRSDDY